MSHHVLEGTLDQLSRFAYKFNTPSPRAPTNSVHPGPSCPVVLVSDGPPNSQFTQLSKCIACGLQWTSRKTTKQKRTHIEQCAKKNGLTKDTIRTLLEKETAPIPAHENAPITLMDSVVSTGPGKKAKRQQVASTVRSLPETRESILDRAKDILGHADGNAEPQPTQQFARSALACQDRPECSVSAKEQPATQPFGVSSLRGGITIKRPGGGCEEDVFPQTQQFGASMLAQESHKRPASPPPPVDSRSRSVRRRLLH